MGCPRRNLKTITLLWRQRRLPLDWKLKTAFEAGANGFELPSTIPITVEFLRLPAENANGSITGAAMCARTDSWAGRTVARLSNVFALTGTLGRAEINPRSQYAHLC